MKRFLSILTITLVTVAGQANNSSSDPNSEVKVEILPSVENHYLSIEVNDALAGSSVTVSVFSSLGEIVLESTLGLGLNKIDVQNLAKGEYTAVVRENGEYTNKQSFVLS